MKLPRPIFVLLLSVVLFPTARRIEAAAGQLDPTFSTDGRTRFGFGAGSGGPHDIVIDASGRTLVAGSAYSGDDGSMAVARYLPDGSLDVSFGDSGISILNVGIRQPNNALSGQEEGQGVAIQPDGKIVVAGYVQVTNQRDIAVVRFNADGSPDLGFGAGGMVTIDLFSNDAATDVAIQADGKIVVAGASGGNFAVVRLNPDGQSLDSNFNGGYVVMTGIIGNQVFEAALRLQADEKILVAGSPSGGSPAFYIVRLNKDGSYDMTFGSGGLVARGTSFGTDAHCTSIAIQAGSEIISQPDKIVAAGYGYNGNRELFVVMRFTLSGAPDTSFDGDGEVSTDLSGVPNGLARAQAIVVESGQTNIRKLVVAGSVSFNGAGNQSVVLRYNSNGSLDSTFDGDGIAVFDPVVTGSPVSLALTSGKILFSGTGLQGRFYTTRLNSNGSPDTTFDQDGSRVDFFGNTRSVANGVVVQPDGKIVVVGSGGGTFAGFNRSVARLNADGTLDTSFDGDGKAIGTDGTDGPATAVTLQPDGKILVAGSRSVGVSNIDGVVARYNANGSIDNSFAGGFAASGFPQNDGANAIVRQSDGRIVIGGFAVIGTNRDVEVVRFNDDGSLDNTFDFDGKVITSLGTESDEARGIAVQSDGKIVVAGYATNGQRQLFVARFTTSGVLDNSFDQDGVVFTNIGSGDSGANAIVIDRFGRILAAGFSFNGTNYDIAVVRYRPDGSLDPSFGTAGKVVTPSGGGDDFGTGIAIQPDGRIVVSATVNISAAGTGGQTAFALLRYLENGTLDTSYAGGEVLPQFAAVPSDDRREGANAVALDANANAVVVGVTDQLFGVARVQAGPLAIPSTLANVSTRLPVRTGDNALIGGFIVTGTQPKKMILRALGPSVPVPGALGNPTLELYSGSTLIAANDDWKNQPDADRQAVLDSTIPPANDLESALVRTLPANGATYTAIVRGTNGGTGIGVVEAYDLDRTVDSKLANISTRGLVQTGDNVLIAGTIILGETLQRVIVRAIGPSLPIAGRLENPTLELRDQNGGLIEANDDWVNSPNKQAIIDSSIPPSNDKESAIVQILPANGANYTAVVRGVGDTTGIGVVEVYALQ